MNKLLGKIILETATEKDFFAFTKNFAEFTDRANVQEVWDILTPFGIDTEFDSSTIEFYYMDENGPRYTYVLNRDGDTYWVLEDETY